jgi:vacuolar-type H+-ATPase subunit D/Vma8
MTGTDCWKAKREALISEVRSAAASALEAACKAKEVSQNASQEARKMWGDGRTATRKAIKEARDAAEVARRAAGKARASTSWISAVEASKHANRAKGAERLNTLQEIIDRNDAYVTQCARELNQHCRDRDQQMFRSVMLHGVVPESQQEKLNVA